MEMEDKLAICRTVAVSGAGVDGAAHAHRAGEAAELALDLMKGVAARQRNRRLLARDDQHAAAEEDADGIGLDARDIDVQWNLGVLYADYLDQPWRAVEHFAQELPHIGEDVPAKVLSVSKPLLRTLPTQHRKFCFSHV